MKWSQTNHNEIIFDKNVSNSKQVFVISSFISCFDDDNYFMFKTCQELNYLFMTVNRYVYISQIVVLAPVLFSLLNNSCVAYKF